MFIIISNTVKSKISPFIKFIRKDNHQMEFATTFEKKNHYCFFYFDIKQGLNSWLLEVVTGYYIKINLAAFNGSLLLV